MPPSTTGFFLGLALQTSCHALIPGLHGVVGAIGETLLGQDLGKHGTCFGVHNIVLVDRPLQKRHMLLRPQQQLDRLPGHKPLLFQRRHRRACVAVIAGRRLQRVKRAQRAVDEGNRRRWRLGEEHIIVAAHIAIPRRKLRGHQVCTLARLESLALHRLHQRAWLSPSSTFAVRERAAPNSR